MYVCDTCVCQMYEHSMSLMMEAATVDQPLVTNSYASAKV